MVYALNYMPEYLELDRNIFRDDAREIRAGLRKYLKEAMAAVNWTTTGQSVLKFVRSIDWKNDSVITFNYDLLVEHALDKLGISPSGDSILHLHGSLSDKQMAYPTARKFAYKGNKKRFGPRWKKSFEALRSLGKTDRLIFIGYSLPPTDLEARGLFNYADWYNMPLDRYSYTVTVVNNDPCVLANYNWFRRPITLHKMTFAEWVTAGMPA